MKYRICKNKYDRYKVQMWFTGYDPTWFERVILRESIVLPKWVDDWGGEVLRTRLKAEEYLLKIEEDVIEREKCANNDWTCDENNY